MADGLILTMGALTSEAGKRVRPTGTVCARGLNVKENTADVGIMDLKCPVSIPGPAGIPLRASGKMGDDMASASRAKDGGCIKASGPKDIKGNMELYRVLQVERDTKGRGVVDYKMDMDRRRMPMEVNMSSSRLEFY